MQHELTCCSLLTMSFKFYLQLFLGYQLIGIFSLKKLLQS